MFGDLSSLAKLFSFSDMFKTSLFAIGTDVWITVAAVLAVLTAVGGYFLFVKPEKKYPNKIVTWLRNFLNGQELLIEPILKIVYIFVTIYGVLVSFSFIGDSFMLFLTFLVVSLVVTRIVYELILMFVGIYKNTKELSKKSK